MTGPKHAQSAHRAACAAPLPPPNQRPLPAPLAQKRRNFPTVNFKLELHTPVPSAQPEYGTRSLKKGRRDPPLLNPPEEGKGRDFARAAKVRCGLLQAPPFCQAAPLRGASGQGRGRTGRRAAPRDARRKDGRRKAGGEERPRRQSPPPFCRRASAFARGGPPPSALEPHLHAPSTAAIRISTAAKGRRREAEMCARRGRYASLRLSPAGAGPLLTLQARARA